jgi:hypothetical protein
MRTACKNVKSRETYINEQQGFFNFGKSETNEILDIFQHNKLYFHLNFSR